VGFSKFFIIFSLLCVVVFALFPEIDLRVSEIFFDEGKGFFLKDEQPFAFLHDELKWFLIVTWIILFGVLIYQLYSKRDFKYLNKKAIGFLFIFLLIGPGLITNIIIKDHSGRARPINIEHFGADKGRSFTPYYDLSGKCKKNCSFISGHTSAAFFFLAFAYIYKSKLIFALSLAFGALMGVARVVQGAHFLSDVIFAFIINLIILKIIYYLFYKRGAVLEENL
jgi:lipid A 4'-phosphatase